jgi:3-oxoacyl-[acyl-carrier-protein] synthase II
MTTVAITGIGIITPAVSSINDLAGFCAQQGRSPTKKIASIPVPAGRSNRELRRMARQTKLALYAADQALACAGLHGQNGGLYVGLTHGSTSLLQEFHDYLFEYGPQMASPNAFSNGVTNAPLGAISKLYGLTLGGGTLVGYETCGLEVLHVAADALYHTNIPFCCAGATEEYSLLVDDAYTRINWFTDSHPAHLPFIPDETGTGGGLPVSEGSVFFTLSPCDQVSHVNDKKRCLFTPVDYLSDAALEADVIISGASGGPADRFELKALQTIQAHRQRTAYILFSTCFFGELFSVGPLLSAAMAWDMLVNRTTYPGFPLHPSLSQGPVIDPQSVLVLSADRSGAVSAGLFHTDFFWP